MAPEISFQIISGHSVQTVHGTNMGNTLKSPSQVSNWARELRPPQPTQMPRSQLSRLHQKCEDILCGYLYDGDLVFVILKRNSIFKIPERFLEISCRDLTFHFVYNSNHLKDLVIRILWALVMSFSDDQAMILTVILTRR
jgi:hypothetical protein